MDWGKIKTVLIITFIIINLILGYNLYGAKKKFEREIPVEQEVFGKVVTLLADKNISVDVEMESYREFVPSLTVAYQTYSLQEEVTNYLGADFDVIDGVAISGEKAVKIENDTSLKYFYTRPLDAENSATEALAEQVAREFLRDHGYAVPEKPWRIDKQGEFLVVTYKQFYEGYYLDESFMTLEIYDDEVVRFSRKWFESILEKTTNHKVLKPSEALFKVIERAYTETVTYGDTMSIEKMELGYRLEENILLLNLKAGDASPYWRITFSDGRIIYIEGAKG